MPPRVAQGADEAGPSTFVAEKSPAFRFAFLQVLMQRGYLLDADAKALYRRICSVSNDALYFEFLRDVNQQLDYAHFQLRRVKYPGDAQEYIGFVNREADEESKRSGRYRGKDGKPDVRHTAFFRALLESIATEDTGREGGLGFITSTAALNLNLPAEPATQTADGALQASQASALRELSKREREAALGQFAADGWLAAVPDRPGCYTLGVRSLLELGEYILSLDLPDSRRDLLTAIL
ncbi:hypothetical protein N2152v2_001553 [Parachlorella kessleri]